MTPAISADRISRQEMRIRGHRINVEICGEGEPLLLYSGVWAEVGLWAPLLSHLGGFRAITFDAPGIGRSPMPSCPLTMEALAELGTGVLDELGISSAHVLGASFGGAVAQQMAICHAGRVRRLVLVSTSFGGFSVPGDLAALWYFLHLPGYDLARLERAAGAMFGGRLRAEPGLVRSLDFRLPRSARAALYGMAPLLGWTSLPWLWVIRQPTLVICGDDDPIAPQVNHRIIASLVRNARLHTVRGGGHLLLIDSPGEVAPLITEFLRGDQPAATYDGAARHAANGNGQWHARSKRI